MGGPFTFIAGVATERFYKEEPELYNLFLSALDQAILFIKNNRGETVTLLANQYHMDEKTVEDYLYNRGMVFDRDVLGLNRFIAFMSRTGYLEHNTDGESVLF